MGEDGLAATGAEVVAAEVIKVPEERAFCHNLSTQNSKNQEATVSEETCYHADTAGGGGGGGGEGYATVGENKTLQHQHYHSDMTARHQHHDNDKHHQHDHQKNNKNSNQQSHKDEGSYKLVPADGGWGWMVALGAFIIMTLLPMLATCFGVMFSEYLVGTDSSSITTAWIFNMQTFLCNLSGLLAWPLTQEFGWRPVALIGCTTASVGLMLCAFTPSPYFLFFSFSVLTGVGGGVVICQSFTIVPNYFLRRRGLANAIMMCGICMGQLVGPPTARYLQSSYGFRGATLILGALVLNTCIGASFFHPIEWHQKKVPLVEELQDDTAHLPTKEGSANSTNTLFHPTSEVTFPEEAEDIESSLAVRKRLLGRLGGRRESVSSSRQSSLYTSTLSLSFLDMGSLAAMPVEVKMEQEDDEAEEQRYSLPVRVLKALIRDLAALKSLRLCILCLGDMLCLNGYFNFIMMVPFAMVEAGFTLSASAWCISLSAVFNMATRFLVSALTDWPRFNNRLVYICAFGLIAFSILAFTFMPSLEGLMVTITLYGIGVGANMGIYNIVVIEVMGTERLGAVFGSSCFVVGIGSLCLGPFIGLIRDVTQSYAASMRFTSAMVFMGCLLWPFMGLAEKVDQGRENGKTLREVLKKT